MKTNLLSRKIMFVLAGLFAFALVAGVFATDFDPNAIGNVVIATGAVVGATKLGKTAEELAEETNEAIKDIKKMVQNSATVEALQDAIKEFEDFKATIDNDAFAEKMNQLEKDIRKVTSKVGQMSIRNFPGGVQLRDRIKEALETDTWKKHLENRAEGESPIYSLKDIVWGAAAAEGTNDVVHNAMPYMIPFYQFEEPFDVRSFIPVGNTDKGSLDYPKEKVYTDGMGVKGEAAAAGETTITYEMVTENAHRLATFAEVSRRALRNTSWLSNYLANRFMEKFVKLLNTQVLVGDGTGENLDGLTSQATAYAAAGDYTDTIPLNEGTLVDAVLAMKSQLYNTANVTANVCFVSPVTHYQLTVQKTTTRQYAYDNNLVKVDENGVLRINGMSVVQSKDIADGDALIGQIAPTVCEILFNGGIDMATTQSHASNFISSLVAFRFEADVLFPVYRPYAFIKGTLATVLADIEAAA